MAANITDSQIKSAKAKDKRYIISDQGGLFLEIAPSGSKWWRFRYTFAGRRRLMSFGVYPEISLKKARERRDQARVLIAQGVDPLEEKNQAEAKSGPTFGEVAKEWFALKSRSWAESNIKPMRLRLEKYLLSNFDKTPIKDLTTQDFLKVLRGIEGRGKYETAHRIAQMASQISRFARLSGLIAHNPLADIADILIPVKTTHHKAIITPDEIGCMLRDLEYSKSRPVTTFALKIMPYVFVRSGELRSARWDEIDFETRTWTIPAERMKMRKDHVVPLETQVVELFEDLKFFSGDGELCFPSTMSKTRCLTDVGLLNALRRLGYGRDEMCIHGFRGMASTILNEKGYRSDAIEAQLAHADKSQVRAAYNRAEYLDERRQMMQEYADYLDSLKAAQTLE